MVKDHEKDSLTDMQMIKKKKKLYDDLRNGK
jgi:hypothetical protein